MFKLLLDLLFPRSCVGCGREGSYLCQDCARRLQFFPSLLPLPPGSALDSLFAFAQYDELLKAAIHRVKYKGEFAILFDIAPLLATHLPPSYLKSACLVPVPLHRSRERERGFNQSEVLAKALTKELKIPVQLLLAKQKKTPSQATLKRKERLSNLTNAFSILHPDQHIPSTILLVDDVATTGTTLNECARVLKQHGAKKVFGVVLAHGK